MDNQVMHRYGGKNNNVGSLLLNRLLPNQGITTVGPFVLLDHIYPTAVNACEPECYSGKHAHPHRGIVTFSYVLSGALEHLDSAGNRDVISIGEAHWLNTGNGILHNERPAATLQRSGGILHCLQFWINLPSAEKACKPQYLPLRSSDIPEIELPDFAGSIRILIGSCGSLASPVRTFSGEFIYHIKLNPKSRFFFERKERVEYAFFVPSTEIRVNGELFGNSEMFLTDTGTTGITFVNPGIMAADIIIFGGNPYQEPIFAQGPFVMNSSTEISQAYKDFFDGVYGDIAIDGQNHH